MIEAEWWDYDFLDELGDAVAGDVGFIIDSAVDARGSVADRASRRKHRRWPSIPRSLPRSSRGRKSRSSRPTTAWCRWTMSEAISARSPRRFCRPGSRVIPIATEIADYRLAGNSADARLQDLPWPPDLVWLGMGEDGHTASIFAGPDLQDALDAPKARRAIGVMPDPLPTDAPVARVTLTRAAILAARTILITVTGTGNAKSWNRRSPTGRARGFRSAACSPKSSSRSISTGAHKPRLREGAGRPFPSGRRSRRPRRCR